MNKKYSGNGNNKKKIKHLVNNSTILQRISPRAILSVTSQIIPQLKNKIDGLMDKLLSINKEKLLTSVGSLLVAETMLLGIAGCSPQNSNSSQYYFNEFQELEDSIVTELGYNPEEVTIVQGRDGYYLAYTDKLQEGVYLSPNGEVSNRVKVRDENGNTASIPLEAKKQLDEASNKLNSPNLNNKTNTTSEEPERD